jgi:Domain of unknown function (DUF4350)
MLNARNVVVAAVILTLVSFIGACLALLQSPGGGGLGLDTYGTRGQGFRGLYEILADLHVPVERATVPPSGLLKQNMTLALIDPSPEIVSTEPTYLDAVGKWVRGGGSVVVSPSPRKRQSMGVAPPTRNPLSELGLEGLSVHYIRPDSDESSGPSFRSSHRTFGAESKRAARNLKRLVLGQPDSPAADVHATAEGSLQALFPNGLDLVLPAEGRCVLESDYATDPPPASKTAKEKPVEVAGQEHNVAPPNVKNQTLQGRILAVLEPDGEPETVAAVYKVGDGTIAVLADARLAQNRFIARGDNAVLVSHLLADPDRPVVFDEFYHGLTVRSNPLWLLSRFPYDILAASALAATLLVGWRAARFLGPPLSPRPASRRTLSEYIEAMARLLNRSQQPVPFLLREIRQGLLWRLRHDLGLPPGQEDANQIVRILQRRDPALADNTREAIRAIDNLLTHSNQSAKDLETTLAKVSRCVLRRAV